MIDKFLNNAHLPLIIGYILALLSLAGLYWMMFVNRKTVLEDLRGKDKMWQFVELTSVLWMILMPMLVVCDLFGLHASTQVWASMDAIYMISVGGKVANRYFDMKQGAVTKKEGENI